MKSPVLVLRVVAALFVAAWLGGCASLPPPQPTPAVPAITDVASTSLARLAAVNTPPDAAGRSGFRLLPEGTFSLDARIALARRAQKSLDVQYYQIHSDEAGLRLLRELRDAAARGVRVRLLVDDFYTAGQDELFSSLAAFPGIEVRLFNPLPARAGGFATRFLASMHEFNRINHRMHNKLFVADNRFSVSGGRNMGDEYFMLGGGANFIDLDVLATGPVVQEQSDAFDLYWNSGQVWPIAQVVRPAVPPKAAQQRFGELIAALSADDIALTERDALGRTSVARQLAEGRLDQFWGRARVLVDDPAKLMRTTWDTRSAGSVTFQLLDILDTARSRILVVSPYFVPGPYGMVRLKAMVDRGAKIEVLTNSLGATDEPLVYASYARYRDDMLRLGMEIYEVAPRLGYQVKLGEFGSSVARLHAKMAIVDDDRIFIGSMNMDSRSARLNTEIGLMIDSAEVVTDFRRLVPAEGWVGVYKLRLGPQGYVEWVESGNDGKGRVHHDNPDTSWFVEIKNWLGSLLVDEEQL